MNAADIGRLRLVQKATFHAFEVRVVAIPGGNQLRFDERRWQDCLVEVECGEVLLRLRDGRTLVCTAGDVLTFTGLPIRALHNPLRECAALVAISRRRTPLGGAISEDLVDSSNHVVPTALLVRSQQPLAPRQREHQRSARPMPTQVRLGARGRGSHEKVATPTLERGRSVTREAQALAGLRPELHRVGMLGHRHGNCLAGRSPSRGR